MSALLIAVLLFVDAVSICLALPLIILGWAAQPAFPFIKERLKQ